MPNVPFFQHCGPHADFLISSRPTAQLDRTMSSLGATTKRYPSYTAYLWRYPEGETLMSGTGVIDGTFIVGPTALKSPPSTLSVGNYFVLQLKKGEAHVYSDSMGMGVIYAGRGIATNRLHLAALAIGELDICSALTTTYAEHMFCMQFPVDETPVRGIQIIASNEAVKIDNSIRIVQQAPPVDYTIAPPHDYHRLIDEGAREVSDNVRAVLNSGYPVVCDLSGGRDSRVVLAALIALGRIEDVTFYTKVGLKERGQLDAAIGSGLVRRFGGKYGVPARKSGYDVNPVEESIRKRRSQLFGAYHSITPNILNTVTPIYDTPFIRMMGGTGEMYRDYYQRFFRINSGSHRGEHLEDVLRARCGGIFGDLWFDAYFPHFRRTFERMPGDSISQKLDSHYLNFRNRFHFGLRPTRDGAPFTVSPAASNSLLKAAKCLPDSERATGRVLFDVTKALCEELAYYPYDKPPEFDFTDSRYHRPSRFDGSTLDLPPAVEDLTRQKDSGPRRPVAERPPFIPTLRDEIDKSFSELSGSQLDIVVREDLKAHICSVSSTNWRRMAAWTSRLQAFSDYCSILI